MKLLLAILAGLGLAACGGNGATTEAARYDLGSRAAKEMGGGSRLPVAAVEVRAASWLSGPDMHFRLAYAEPQQRRSYAESRWAAPPAELLEAFLTRRILFGQTDPGGAGCRLQVALDELEQRFDSPQGSTTILEVRAQLTSMRGAEALSRRAFLVQKAATVADARGGATAARDAAQTLVDDIGGWLGDISRDQPALVERCRG